MYKNLFYWLTRRNPGSFSRDVLLYLYIACQYCNPGGGGGVLPYITYTGMCRPTGSSFWSSWFRTGYPFQRRFLERGVIFWTHESSSFVTSHLKLFKDILLLKVRFNALARKLLYSCCTLCFGVLRGRIFDVVQLTQVVTKVEDFSV